MYKYLTAAAGAVLLGGCAALGGGMPMSPGSMAHATVLDERAALGAELAYAAARTALGTAVDAGLLKGSSATRAAGLDRSAYGALLAVRSAYAAGNAASYASALDTARAAIGELLRAVRPTEGN